VSRLSNLDVIDRVLERLPNLAGNETLVADLASPPDDLVASLGELAQACGTDDAQSWAVAARRGAIPSRSTQSVRAAAAVLGDVAGSRDSCIRAPHGGGVLVAEADDGGRQLVFGAGAVATDDRALAVLARFLDGRAHRIGAVVEAGAAVLGEPTALAVVGQAVEVGLLDVVGTADWGVIREDA
jgi:hypothetical protein